MRRKTTPVRAIGPPLAARAKRDSAMGNTSWLLGRRVARFVPIPETVGDVYVDDVRLVAGGTPEVEPICWRNGGFESAFPGPFLVSPNHGKFDDQHYGETFGNASLHMVATAGGTTRGLCNLPGPHHTSYAKCQLTLSYWYLRTQKRDLPRCDFRQRNQEYYRHCACSGQRARSTPGVINNVTASLPDFHRSGSMKSCQIIHCHSRSTR